MKLKKNDLQELKKSGGKAIDAKLHTLRLELSEAVLNQKRRTTKDFHLAKMLRRSIAQLKTIKTNLEKK